MFLLQYIFTFIILIFASIFHPDEMHWMQSLYMKLSVFDSQKKTPLFRNLFLCNLFETSFKFIADYSNLFCPDPILRKSNEIYGQYEGFEPLFRLTKKNHLCAKDDDSELTGVYEIHKKYII